VGSEVRQRLSGVRSVNDARSRELYAQALSLMPGGVSSPVRAMGAMGRPPLFIDQASGCELVDTDGNRYVDYVCSWGPLIAGHAHPRVVEAVERAARKGTSFGAPTQAEIDLTRAVVERVPSAEMVRLVNSGTEAAMTALRLARSATGRDKIVKFAGGYHGHVDGLLAEAGSGLATQGIPASPGVTSAQAGDTLVVPWNDRQAFERAIKHCGERLAAVIAELVPANMGVVPPRPGFLELLRNSTREAGALLIADEVITGFRVARGGAQELFELRPDLSILGKVLGGGLPLAAVAGPRGLMEQLAPAGDTYQAGTLSGNPVATAAGLATLELLDDGAYERLTATTDSLAYGLRAAAADAGICVHVPALCGLLTVFFSERPVSNYDDARAAVAASYARFFNQMLARGVYLPPSAFEAWFPSLAHDEDAVARTLDAAAEAFTAVASGSEGNG
jgi:glutamate-1-semialdehyde 2,1-aminomutase